MSNTILVTDSLFIFKEHEEILKKAGYSIERLDKPEATEDELIKAIKGKSGYILGGIEKVTEKVIAAADELKAIAFTGSDWKAFIPGHESAAKRGIAISNTPGANSYSVAEFALTLMYAMNRNIFELGRTGTKKFQTMHSLDELTVGIIGMGHVGSILAKNVKNLGAKQVIYYSKTKKPEVEKEGIEYQDMDKLLSESDVVFLLVPKSLGSDFIGSEQLKLMKDGTLLINIGSRALVNKDALFAELQSARLRAAQEGRADDRFDELPTSVWFNTNESAAYNTRGANKMASDMAVKSILNMLKDGKDEFRVN